jgi:hypothetical protein
LIINRISRIPSETTLEAEDVDKTTLETSEEDVDKNKLETSEASGLLSLRSVHLAAVFQGFVLVH